MNRRRSYAIVSGRAAEKQSACSRRYQRETLARMMEGKGLHQDALAAFSVPVDVHDVISLLLHAFATLLDHNRQYGCTRFLDLRKPCACMHSEVTGEIPRAQSCIASTLSVLHRQGRSRPPRHGPNGQGTDQSSPKRQQKPTKRGETSPRKHAGTIN